MVSKGWKFSLVLLVAMSLAACSDDEKHNDIDRRSSYSGMWASEFTVEVYKEYQRALRSNELGAFCRETFFYYQNENQLVLESLWIKPNGEVFRYRDGDREGHRNFRRDNWWGVLSADGQFTDRCRVRDQFNSYACSEENSLVSRFYPNSKNQLTIYSTSVADHRYGDYDRRYQEKEYSESSARVFVRVSNKHLRGFGQMEADCMVSENRRNRSRKDRHGKVQIDEIQPEEWEELEEEAK